jgi:hypothetical protein
MMNSFKDLLDSGKFTFPEEALQNPHPDDFSDEEANQQRAEEGQQSTQGSS